MVVPERAERMGDRVNGTQSLAKAQCALERAHHHAPARFTIRAIAGRALDVRVEPAQAIKRDRVERRVEGRRTVRLNAVRQGIHACCRRHGWRKAQRELRVANRGAHDGRATDARLDAIVKNDHRRAPDFASTSCCRRHQHDGRWIDDGPGARIAVAVLPERRRVAAHHGDCLGQIEGRATAYPDDAVAAKRGVTPVPRIDSPFRGIRWRLVEHNLFSHFANAFGRKTEYARRPDTTIRHEQWSVHAQAGKLRGQGDSLAVAKMHAHIKRENWHAALQLTVMPARRTSCCRSGRCRSSQLENSADVLPTGTCPA